MKWIGFAAGLALVTACFFPWVFIESKNVIVSGTDAGGTTFGKPGYFHLLFGSVFLVLNFIPSIWAKRLNILVAALNIGWALRNYFIISACSGGECPVKKTALYVVLISSIVILLSALMPSVKLPEKDDKNQEN